MTITYHADVVQGSDEWAAMRCGLLTASEMHFLVTPTLKIANNDKSRSHDYELLAQRITRYVEPRYVSDDMLRGQSDEIDARALYAKKYAPIQEVGFITNDKWGLTIGYSPDALVGDDGLIECKSRRAKFQVQTIIDGVAPADYMIQLQTGLLVSEREWIDFVSYSGGLPMFVTRVEPIQEYQDAIIAAATGFEERLAMAQEKYAANSKGLHPTERRIIEEIYV